MSYPHLSPGTATECSRAAYDYDPNCYCAIHWVFSDYLPRPQYHNCPTKWLEAYVWRSIGAGRPDRFVAMVVAETGPEMLRLLRDIMTAITLGEKPDPSLPARHESPPRFVPRNPHKPIGFLTAAQRAAEL